jgi:hypothetical protein
MYPQFTTGALRPGLLRTDYSGNQSIGDWREMHDEELHNFHSSANTATTVFFFKVSYLTTLSISRLYSGYDEMINEYAAVSGVRINREN